MFGRFGRHLCFRSCGLILRATTTVCAIVRARNPFTCYIGVVELYVVVCGFVVTVNLDAP